MHTFAELPFLQAAFAARLFRMTFPVPRRALNVAGPPPSSSRRMTRSCAPSAPSPSSRTSAHRPCPNSKHPSSTRATATTPATPATPATLLLLLLRTMPSLRSQALWPLCTSPSAPSSRDTRVPAATALRTTAHAQSSPHYPRLQTIPTSTRGSYPGASAASSSSVSPLSAPASRRYRRAGMLWGNATRKRDLPPAALPARRSGC